MVARNGKNGLFDLKMNEEPITAPVLDHFILNPISKLTDFISTAMLLFGFIVS
jgi:hypothetical protein